MEIKNYLEKIADMEKRNAKVEVRFDAGDGKWKAHVVVKNISDPIIGVGETAEAALKDAYFQFGSHVITDSKAD